MKSSAYFTTAFLISALSILIFTGCNDVVTGNGEVASETRSVGDFNGITVGGSMHVFIRQGPVGNAKIEAESNIIPYIELKNNGDQLMVRFKHNTSINTHDPVSIYLTAPQINDLKLLGSGSIQTQDTLTGARGIKVKIAGSGNIDLKMNAPEIDADIAGSGNITAEGETKNMEIKIAGSGDFKGENLKSENADVKIAGSGNATLFSSLKLNVKIMGSGNVYYQGNPSVGTSIAGSGKVIRQN